MIFVVPVGSLARILTVIVTLLFVSSGQEPSASPLTCNSDLQHCISLASASSDDEALTFVQLLAKKGFISSRLALKSWGSSFTADLSLQHACGILWFYEMPHTGGELVTKWLIEMKQRKQFDDVIFLDHMPRAMDYWTSNTAVVDAIVGNPKGKLVAVHHGDSAPGLFNFGGVFSHIKQRLQSHGCDLYRMSFLAEPLETLRGSLEDLVPELSLSQRDLPSIKERFIKALNFSKAYDNTMVRYIINNKWDSESSSNGQSIAENPKPLGLMNYETMKFAESVLDEFELLYFNNDMQHALASLSKHLNISNVWQSTTIESDFAGHTAKKLQESNAKEMDLRLNAKDAKACGVIWVYDMGDDRVRKWLFEMQHANDFGEVIHISDSTHRQISKVRAMVELIKGRLILVLHQKGGPGLHNLASMFPAMKQKLKAQGCDLYRMTFLEEPVKSFKARLTHIVPAPVSKQDVPKISSHVSDALTRDKQYDNPVIRYLINNSWTPEAPASEVAEHAMTFGKVNAETLASIQTILSDFELMGFVENMADSTRRITQMLNIVNTWQSSQFEAEDVSEDDDASHDIFLPSYSTELTPPQHRRFRACGILWFYAIPHSSGEDVQQWLLEMKKTMQFDEVLHLNQEGSNQRGTYYEQLVHDRINMILKDPRGSLLAVHHSISGPGLDNFTSHFIDMKQQLQLQGCDLYRMALLGEPIQVLKEQLFSDHSLQVLPFDPSVSQMLDMRANIKKALEADNVFAYDNILVRHVLFNNHWHGSSKTHPTINSVSHMEEGDMLRAKRIFQEFDFVFSTNNLEASFQIIAKQLNLTNARSREAVLQSALAKDGLDKLLGQATEFDSQLYEHMHAQRKYALTPARRHHFIDVVFGSDDVRKLLSRHTKFDTQLYKAITDGNDKQQKWNGMNVQPRTILLDQRALSNKTQTTGNPEQAQTVHTPACGILWFHDVPYCGGPRVSKWLSDMKKSEQIKEVLVLHNMTPTSQGYARFHQVHIEPFIADPKGQLVAVHHVGSLDFSGFAPTFATMKQQLRAKECDLYQMTVLREPLNLLKSILIGHLGAGNKIQEPRLSHIVEEKTRFKKALQSDKLYDNMMTHNFLRVDNSKLFAHKSEDALTLAKSILSGIDFIGFHNDLERSIDLVTRQIHVNNVWARKAILQSAMKDDVAGLIWTRAMLDWELYENLHAKRHLPNSSSSTASLYSMADLALLGDDLHNLLMDHTDLDRMLYKAAQVRSVQQRKLLQLEASHADNVDLIGQFDYMSEM